MPIVKATVTQPGNDTLGATEILTGLTPDGGLLWSIKSVRFFWADAVAAGATSFKVNGVLSRQQGSTTFMDDELLAFSNWQLTAVGSVTVAVATIDAMQMWVPQEPVVTAQPKVWLQCASVGTGTTNTIDAHIEYQTVKASQIEVLRLLQVGA